MVETQQAPIDPLHRFSTHMSEYGNMAIDAALLDIEVRNAFDDIGFKGPTAFPKSKPPREVNDAGGWLEKQRAAWELWVAQRLRSRANKRYDMAKDLCQALGIVNDEKIEPGSSATTFNGAVVSICVKKNHPVVKFDHKVAAIELALRGVKPEIIKAVWVKAQVTQKPATVIEPTLQMEG